MAQLDYATILGDGSIGVYFGTAAPTNTDFSYKVGDIVWNTAPSAGNASHWRCVVAGAPGTWKAVNCAS